MAELRELVSAAKKGDRDAFSQLYQEVYKDLYKFALYCLKDSFRPWIFRILSAKCKRRMRSYVRRRSETDLESADVPVSPGFESGESLELRRAMAQLSDEERLILSLVVVSGYDSGEAAAILGMNRNTLRSRQSRALAKLKTLLTEE